MIYIFLLLASLGLHASTSAFDLSYGTQGRTLPSFGAEFYGDAGYSRLLWGEKKNPKDVLYGVARTSVGATTSAVVNAFRGEIEVFPISFFGVAIGRQYMHSNFDFPFFDCKQVSCQGEYQRNYVETKMVLGHQGWIVLGSYKVDTLLSPDEQLAMADWRNVIVGEPGEEVQIDKKLMLGKIFGHQMIGVLIENTLFVGSRERKESFAALYQTRRNDTSYMFGIGGFHTDQQPMGFQFYFRIHQVKIPSLKLF